MQRNAEIIKICLYCLHSGEPKRITYDDSLITLAGFILGLGFIWIPIELFKPFVLDFESLFLLAFPVGCFLIGTYLIASCFNVNSDTCPKCQNGRMTDHINNKTSEPIEQSGSEIPINNILATQKICVECNYIGNEIHDTKFILIGALFLIFIGITSFPTYYTSSIIHAFGSIIWLIFGIYILISHLTKRNRCPSCKKSRTMIPLDTPRAQELIKEHNHTVPTK
jgi:hypothetical protein